MDYWQLREFAKKLVPRRFRLSVNKDKYKQKEKGRKSNYHQYSISNQKMEKMERLLNKDNINSFAEVSLRAQSCPMPLNIDVWDGIKCPFQCKYCYADYFKHSLYTSFFDNSKSIGLRHCNPTEYKKGLDELFKHRGENTSGENKVLNAIRLEIPIRLGIRFEDFPPIEAKKGIALNLLQYLSDQEYPLMINTKSDLLKEERYLKALTSNKAKTAVHVTLISSDEKFLKKIEPGAPTFKRRLEAMRVLSEAGIRVVARIEPWMMYINDNRGWVDNYIRQLKGAGIKHMTFDSYSYSAYSKGLSENFTQLGMDFERMFLLSSDSQWLSSLFLGKFMEYFRDNGLLVSTFDQGNVPSNDDWICCSVGDWFEKGFNWGCGVIAIKYIKSKSPNPVRWSDFEKFVLEKGGWLSNSLREEVKILWNGEGNASWPIYWGVGITPVGQDRDGVIWNYNPDFDFREYQLGGLK